MFVDYSPIVLDSINYENFPSVELYVKNENNFALYKPAQTKLTTHNIERLRENGTEIVYINSANSAEVQDHIENRFDSVNSSKTVPQLSKNLICSQIIISSINNVFTHSHLASAFHKCRTILNLVELKFDDRDDLIALFAKLEQYFEKYLVTHTAQVTILSMYVYEQLFNAGRDELIDVGVGAMLHDIGMLHIASDIIEKTDVLSESEYHRVKFHPKQGHDMMSRLGIKETVPLDIALDHHERYDGSGYPRGLSEQKIPRHAMLVSICDIYCALTMNRPYRSASTPEEALKTLRSEKKLFDPQIFDAFLQIMTKTPLPEVVEEEQVAPKAAVKTQNSGLILELRNTMRASLNDRNKLLQLHSVVTDNLNSAVGEEKAAMVAFRTELKDLLNSLFAADRQN